MKAVTGLAYNSGTKLRLLMFLIIDNPMNWSKTPQCGQ